MATYDETHGDKITVLSDVRIGALILSFMVAIFFFPTSAPQDLRTVVEWIRSQWLLQVVLDAFQSESFVYAFSTNVNK